jgi:hypothetical protein
MRNFLFHLVLFFASVAALAGAAFAGGELGSPSSGPEEILGRSTGWTPFHFPMSDGLDRTAETLGSPSAEAPLTGSQEYHQSSRSSWGSFFSENCILRQLSGYILFSRTILPGLPVSRIIFPFHAFG